MTYRRLRALLRRIRVGGPGSVRVPCRDQAGHRGHLEVTAVDNGVVLRTPDAGLVHLTPLHIGRLRAALRDAVLAPPPDERHP